jgi:hypothetical protein
MFIAKYDGSGNVVWVNVATGASDEEGRCIAIANSGDIFVGGSYVPNTDFGGFTLSGWGNYDAFVARYSNTGSFKGVIKAGGSYWNEYVYGISVDAFGDIYTSGSFCGTSYFDSDSLVATTSGFQIFVAKIDKTLEVAEFSSENNSLVLFPNPTSGKIKVNTVGVMKIFDIGGRFIRKIEVGNSADQTEIDLGDLSPGLYFVQINDGKKISTGKFVKQ